MAPKVSKRPTAPPLPLHISNPSLQKFLLEHNGEEYITPKGKIRARNLLSALHRSQSLPLEIGEYLERAHQEFWERDVLDYVLSLPIYTHLGQPIDRGEDTVLSEEAADRNTGDDITSPSSSRKKRKEKKKAAEGSGADQEGSSRKKRSKKKKQASASEPSAEEMDTSEKPTDDDEQTDKRVTSEEPSDKATSEESGDSDAVSASKEDEEPSEAEERNSDATGAGNNTGDDANQPKKRFKLTLESIASLRKDKQEYDSKMIPIKPRTYVPFKDEKGNEITKDKDLPEHLITKEFYRAMEIFMEVNGQPCYDSEAIALGEITEEEYFLVPNTSEVPTCGPEAVLCGLKKFDPEALIVAQVYGLAKRQAGRIGIPKDRRIKWALMRTQAYVAGWYCGQRYTRYETPPSTSLTDYFKDTANNKKMVKTAYKLASFVPFFNEFTFRTQGSTWSSARSAEFEAKANKLANSTQIVEDLKFTNIGDILGTAFRWIGVSRVMEVLKRSTEKSKIPNVFIIRKVAPPAGQAFVTTTDACLTQIETAGWYDALRIKGKYTDDVMKRVAAKLTQDPWKYHMMSSAYGLEPLSKDEEEELKLGRAQAEKLAPMAHAYAIIFLDGYDLSRNKVLVKYANNAGATFSRYQKFFEARKRERAHHVDDLFCTHAFTTVPAKEKKRKRKPRRNVETEDETDDEE